jgi:hypothetical protein
MFIERRLPEILFALEERDIWSSEKPGFASLSEADMLPKVSIDISPLCDGDRIFVELFFRTIRDTTLEEKR